MLSADDIFYASAIIFLILLPLIWIAQRPQARSGRRGRRALAGLRKRHPRRGVRRDVAERHRRPQRDAAARIVPAHHAVHVGAARMETGDRQVVAVEHARRRVGAQSRERAEAARHDAHRIERTAFDRRDAGVRRLLRIAAGPLVPRVAAPESAIASFMRVVVVIAECLLQRGRGDAARAGQRFDRVAALHDSPNAAKGEAASARVARAQGRSGE